MEGRRFWFMILGAAWAIAWAGSFLAFSLTEPDGDGFTRGLNRVTAFLGWQGIAGVLALALLGIGRSWPPGNPVRRLSRVPLWLAAALVLALVALVTWARFAG